MQKNLETTKELETMKTDARILRYLITDSAVVHSTASKDQMGCKYIYVKPGMYDKIMGISNIDFVQTIYAVHGINLRKHKSHLDGKEEEVLMIPGTEILNLSDTQGKFLVDTAPLNYRHSDRMARYRTVELVNIIFQRKKKEKQATR